MAISMGRTLRHGTFLALALVAATVLYPAQAYAGCCSGGCPTGERATVNITLRVTPAGSGYIKVNGDEVDDDVYVAFQGDELELEAVPAQGYVFDKWSVSINSGQNPMEKLFYTHDDITATFVQ